MAPCFSWFGLQNPPPLVSVFSRRLLSVAVWLRGLCAVNIVHTSSFLLPRGCFTQKINFFVVWDIAEVFFFFFFYRLKPCGLSSPFSTYCGCVKNWNTGTDSSEKMYFAALQEVQSDKCKLLSFPVLVWRLVKIWVAGRPQIVFVLFFSLHKSWFRWKALVSEHHLTMLILMHMLFFLLPSPLLTALFLFWWEQQWGKNLAGSYYNILKICSFCFWVLIRYGRSYYLSVPFREKYYLTLLSVWVTFNTLA